MAAAILLPAVPACWQGDFDEGRRPPWTKMVELRRERYTSAVRSCQLLEMLPMLGRSRACVAAALIVFVLVAWRSFQAPSLVGPATAIVDPGRVTVQNGTLFVASQPLVAIPTELKAGESLDVPQVVVTETVAPTQAANARDSERSVLVESRVNHATSVAREATYGASPAIATIDEPNAIQLASFAVETEQARQSQQLREQAQRDAEDEAHEEREEESHAMPANSVAQENSRRG
jgi:hypothetical protein